MITIEKHVGNHHKDYCASCDQAMPEAKMRFVVDIQVPQGVGPKFVLCRACLVDLVQQGFSALLLG